jgi:glycosyltransferase involved in cell wall biosynthesis
VVGHRTGVLWVTKGLGPGGAERLLVSFAARGDHERFAFHAAYLLREKEHLVPALRSHGVTVHPLRGRRIWWPGWVRRLRQVVVANEIEVVHFHSPLVAAIGRPALRALPERHRPALVTTEHNVDESHHALTRLLSRLSARADDARLAVSEEVRASLPAAVARDTDVVLHGVDVEAIAARAGERASARAALGVPPDSFVVGSVANLRATKDLPTLLRAAKRVLDDGVDAWFVHVGQGPLADELAALHRELGLGPRFQLLGYHADPVAVLVGIDAFALSSRHEGLPIALLEALACGVPVAVTAVGGIPTVVRGGEEGFLVPPGDPGALAAAIARLAEPRTRAPMAAAARARATAFDIGQAVDAQQRLYETLARGRRDDRRR